MFGMDKGKNNDKASHTVFNMEETLKKNPQKKKEIIDSVASRMESLKSMLRKGHNDQKQYDQIAFLLHGYNAMVKVINRIK